jgi:hypothetical protein
MTSPRLTNVVNQMEKDNRLVEEVCRCHIRTHFLQPIADGETAAQRLAAGEGQLGAVLAKIAAQQQQ